MKSEKYKGLFGFFFLRPTFAMLLIMIMLITGYLAYVSISKEIYPDLEIPQATISTKWEGADPETIEQLITNKLEKKLKSLRGIRKLRSASFDSISMIAVRFEAHLNLNDAMQRLRAKVDEARADIPKQAETSIIRQVSVDDTPILTIAVFGDADPAVMGNLAYRIKDYLEKVSGVNEVELGGRRKEIISIRIYLSRAEALGISPTIIAAKIQQANIDMPWDKFESEEMGSTFRLYGRFRDVESLKQLPIMRLHGGRVVRLKEVAEVKRDIEKEKTIVAVSWKGSKFKPCIDISVTKASGVDTIHLIEKLKKVLKDLSKASFWPYGIDYKITSSQAEDIEENLNTVLGSGWQAMCCVFLVLFFMLTWREALIAGLAIPLTFTGALGFLWVFGHTLNEMLIIGMVLAVGLLVDVFILMMEGMHDGIFLAKLSFEEAAQKTINHFAIPALSGQLTTILAMVPLLMIAGIDGKFIRIIPITAIVCLILSLIIALFVTVPVSQFLLKRDKKKIRETFIDRITAKIAKNMTEATLRTTLKNKKTATLCVIFSMIIFVLSVMGSSYLPSLLYPKGDGRNLGITIELPPDSTLQYSHTCAKAVREALRKKKYFESVVSFTGKKSPLALNSIGEYLTPTEDIYIVGISCKFTKRKEREKLGFEYLEELRAEIHTILKRFPGSRLTLAADIGGAKTEDPLQIEISGDDMDILRDISKKIQVELQKIPGSVDIRDNLGPSRPEIKAIPRREALNFYKINLPDLAQQVRFAMTSEEISKFPIGGVDEDLEIRLSTAWPSRSGKIGGPTNVEEAQMLTVFKGNGETLPILAVMKAVFDKSPLAITRKNGMRSVTVMCKTNNRTVMEILQDFEPTLKKMKKKWPENYRYHFAGEAEDSAETFSSAGKMFFVSMFLVFALLSIQFDSFSQPFAILFCIPLALIGVCGGFFLAWIPFSFTAMVGVISLIGIVVNNAIIMIETMNMYRKTGFSVRESAAKGSADRLRPILSTTITTIVGMIPLALSDPSWMPLCAAIIFGLAISTATSVIIIPCIYFLLTKEVEKK